MSAAGVICEAFIGLLISDILNVLKTIRAFYKSEIQNGVYSYSTPHKIKCQ